MSESSWEGTYFCRYREGKAPGKVSVSLGERINRKSTGFPINLPGESVWDKILDRGVVNVKTWKQEILVL